MTLVGNHYDPAGPTISRFHHAHDFFRLIMGPMGCLAGDTRVITERGLVQISTIEPGERVLSWSPMAGQFQRSATSGGNLKGSASLYRVRTSTGEWRAHAKHRVLLASGEYVPVDSLRVGQEIAKASQNLLLPLPLPALSPIDQHQILSIEQETFATEYWDLCVADTHNYVTADGSIHHNSGKTTAACIESFVRATQIPPNHQGVRHGRAAIIRNRISDIEATTLKTWNETFEDHFGRATGTATSGGFVHRWNFPLADGTIVNFEARFFPFDSQADIKRLLGSEYTFAFLNECRELPQSLMNVLPGRLRYPKPATLVDPSTLWHGIFADTNPPDSGHWLYNAFEEGEIAPGWRMFRQPPAVIRDAKSPSGWVLNPKAENLQNLRPDYYASAIAGQPDDVVRVYYANEYGYIKAGKLIVPNFSDYMHVAQKRLEFNRDIEDVYLGIDFGATPAAAFLQQDAEGRWFMIRELISIEKPGIREFGELVIRPMISRLEAVGHNIIGGGDPTGKATTQTEGQYGVDCFDILRALGIPCEPVYSNSIRQRAEVVDSLCREVIGGRPRFMVSPCCKTTIKGFAQKYVYAAIGKTSDDPKETRYRDVPRKEGNAFSHVCDAVGYGIMASEYGEDFDDAPHPLAGEPIHYVNRYSEHAGRPMIAGREYL